MNENRFLSLARQVMTLPTAPFHERFVSDWVRSYARTRRRLSLNVDEYGNLMLIYRGPEVTGQATPELVATAHIDHPGLGWLERAGDRIHVFEMLGGTNLDQARQARARIFQPDGPADQPGILGTVVEVVPGDGNRRAAIHVQVPRAADARIEAGCFGMWALPAWKLSGRRIHCRACDDLGGAAVGLAFLEDLARRRAEVCAGLLLTRAEEAGLLGMVATAQTQVLPADALLVNLECSNTRAGAPLGEGPVVRVGDRVQTFDPDLTAALDAAGRELAAAAPGFRYQRKLMDGGTCEATVLAGSGYRAAAIALPLGNYHNIGDERLQAEIIHLDDALGAVDLLSHLARAPGGAAGALSRWQERRSQQWTQRFNQTAERLRSTV